MSAFPPFEISVLLNFLDHRGVSPSLEIPRGLLLAFVLSEVFLERVYDYLGERDFMVNRVVCHRLLESFRNDNARAVVFALVFLGRHVRLTAKCTVAIMLGCYLRPYTPVLGEYMRRLVTCDYVPMWQDAYVLLRACGSNGEG